MPSHAARGNDVFIRQPPDEAALFRGSVEGATTREPDLPRIDVRPHNGVFVFGGERERA